MIVGFPGTTVLDRAERTGDLLKSGFRSQQSAGDRPMAGELKNAAAEFESLFVAYLLKVMRETIEESGFSEGGLGKGIYTELFDQEVARAVARQSPLGISDIILRDVLQGADTQPSGPSGRDGARRDGNGATVSPVSGGPVPSTDGSAGVPDFRLPVRAPISSGFGLRKDPLDRQLRFHRGIDLAAPEGTTVRAALGGRVAFAGFQRGYGKTVVVEHSGGIQTRYAHMGSVDVRTGDAVRDEESIGTVGSTGRSTGPHLHFEVRRLGYTIDPAETALE